MIIIIRLVLLLSIPFFSHVMCEIKADEFVLYSISQSEELLHVITLIPQNMFKLLQMNRLVTCNNRNSNKMIEENLSNLVAMTCSINIREHRL